MKNLYNSNHAFRRVSHLALHHHKARIRKKNLKRLKRKRYGLFLHAMMKIRGTKLPKRKRSKILNLISIRKLIDIDVLPTLRMSNSLDTPIDTMMEYSRLRLNDNYIPAKLKLDRRLPDYKRKIELKEGNILNE